MTFATLNQMNRGPYTHIITLAPPASHDAISRHLEAFPAELSLVRHIDFIREDPIITTKSQPLPVADVRADGSNKVFRYFDHGASLA